MKIILHQLLGNVYQCWSNLYFGAYAKQTHCMKLVNTLLDSRKNLSGYEFNDPTYMPGMKVVNTLLYSRKTCLVMNSMVQHICPGILHGYHPNLGISSTTLFLL
jgi:hypothetical protein